MADAANVAELNEFLAGVEKRAFRMAQIAVKDTEEALDIVQDTMLTLVRKYADKPAVEWRVSRCSTLGGEEKIPGLEWVPSPP